MDYSEEYRSQLRQNRHLSPPAGAVRPDDPRRAHQLVHQSQGGEPQVIALNQLGQGAAFDDYRARLSISAKLRILGGQDCSASADAGTYDMATDPCDDFATDSPIRKLGRVVFWHCECLYYQLLGRWIGARVERLKQKWIRLPDRRYSAAH